MSRLSFAPVAKVVLVDLDWQAIRLPADVNGDVPHAADHRRSEVDPHVFRSSQHESPPAYRCCVIVFLGCAALLRSRWQSHGGSERLARVEDPEASRERTRRAAVTILAGLVTMIASRHLARGFSSGSPTSDGRSRPCSPTPSSAHLLVDGWGAERGA